MIGVNHIYAARQAAERTLSIQRLTLNAQVMAEDGQRRGTANEDPQMGHLGGMRLRPIAFVARRDGQLPLLATKRSESTRRQRLG
jgi:hypothetical protein